MKKIFLSLLGTSEDQILSKMNKLGPLCDGFHIDVMDGCFVKNHSFEGKIFDDITKESSKQLFVHFMVDDPQKYIDPLSLKPHDLVAFHIETTTEIRKIISSLRSKKLSPGIAINPKTPLEHIYPFLNNIDFVLVMSVEPGASGKPFILESFAKIEKLAIQRSQKNAQFLIAVDGGVNIANIQPLASLGVDIFAIGSSVVNAQAPEEKLRELYTRIR